MRKYVTKRILLMFFVAFGDVFFSFCESVHRTW